MTRRTSKLKITGIALLAIAFILSIVFMFLTIASRNRLQVQMAASGKILTLQDIASETLPTSENAAVIYSRIASALKDPTAAKDVKILADAGSMTPDQLKQNPSLLNQAKAAADRTTHIKTLAENAISRPKCRFDVDWSNPIAATETMMSYGATLRQASYILVGTATEKASEKKSDEAIHLIELAFRLNEALLDEPSIISQMNRKSLIVIAGLGLRQTLQSNQLNTAQARHLYDYLGSIDLVHGHIRAIQGERACGLWMLEIFRDPAKMAALHKTMSKTTGQSPAQPPTLGKYMYYLGLPLFYSQKAALLDVTNKHISSASLPYQEAESKGLLPKESDYPNSAYSAVMTAHTLRLAFRARDGAAAEIAGCRVLLAVQAYRNRYGTCPASLNELRAKLGWTIPQDPFSGKDLVYRQQGKGFMLYSIGENLKDDGGKRSTSRKPGEADDIVWEIK